MLSPERYFGEKSYFPSCQYIACAVFREGEDPGKKSADRRGAGVLGL
jgi:hypothetical protein